MRIVNLASWLRNLDTQRRVRAIMWQQRAEAIREELRSLRMTW